MLEEVEMTQQSQKIKINNQIVKLLREKTLPLNQLRYIHLQKINGVSIKSSKTSSVSTPRLQHINIAESQCTILPLLSQDRTSRQHQSLDLLANRLKQLKDLKGTSRLLSTDQKTGRCWQNLRSSIMANDHLKSPQHLKDQIRTTKGSQKGKRMHRERFHQLTQRAYRYLRFKKHQLKLKHKEKQETQSIGWKKKRINPSQIQILIGSFDSHQKEKITDADLQEELLHDIRQIMLEEKINRIKKDINHRKIVQLR